MIPKQAIEKAIVKVGGYVSWRELGGTPHKGTVVEIDSNVAYVECEYHGKECPLDNV